MTSSSSQLHPLECFDCGEPYGRPEWIEAIIPHDVWKKIAPCDGDGLLCIKCIAKRLIDVGLIDVPVKITAGPMHTRECPDCGKLEEETKI